METQCPHGGFLSSSLVVPFDVIATSCAAALAFLLLFLILGVSFNSVYTQIWRVLLHLAADPYPDVSDLAMKVLNSIAYKVRPSGVTCVPEAFLC